MGLRGNRNLGMAICLRAEFAVSSSWHIGCAVNVPRVVMFLYACVGWSMLFVGVSGLLQWFVGYVVYYYGVVSVECACS